MLHSPPPGSRHGPRNPRVTLLSNPRRPRPGDTPRKFLCRLKSPTSPTNDQNEPLKSRVRGRLHGLGHGTCRPKDRVYRHAAHGNPSSFGLRWPLPPLSGSRLMRSERERKHARERGLVHAQNDQVAQSPRRPLTTPREVFLLSTCASVGLCVHARR